MASISKTFSAAGVSNQILLKQGEIANYTLSGTFAGSVQLEKSTNGGQSWEIVVGPYTSNPSTSGIVMAEGHAGNTLVRWNCLVRTSGSAVTTLYHSVPVTAKKRLMINGAKAGTTSGFVVNAADNISLSTCPAGQTASTLVVPIAGLTVGDKIVGFHLVGQVESAGGAVSIDAELRKHTAAAADVADASIASMTQLGLTADAILSASNTQKAGLEHVVAEDESYYILITATTASATDIALQGIAILVVPA